MVHPSGERRHVHPDDRAFADSTGWVVEAPDTNPAASRAPSLPTGEQIAEQQVAVRRGSPLSGLPAAGATLGGLAGGGGGTVFGLGFGGVPGAIGGATIGAAGGEAVRQLGERALGLEGPETPFDAARRIAIEGAIGGSTEAAGAGAAGALKFAGKGLSRIALKTPGSIKTVFGDVQGDVVQRERLAPGKGIFPEIVGGKLKRLKGSEKATEKIKELAKKRLAVLTRAEQQGSSFTADDFTTQMDDLLNDIAEENPANPMSIPEYRAALKEFDRFITNRTYRSGNRAIFTPAEARKMLSKLQRRADKIMAAEAGGKTIVPSATSARGQAMRNMAGSGRDAMESQIPEVGPLNSRMRDLIGTRAALQKAEMREASPFLGPVALLSSLPSVTGRVGLGLTNPLALLLARYSPRASAELIRSVMNENAPEAKE